MTPSYATRRERLARKKAYAFVGHGPSVAFDRGYELGASHAWGEVARRLMAVAKDGRRTARGSKRVARGAGKPKTARTAKERD